MVACVLACASLLLGAAPKPTPSPIAAKLTKVRIVLPNRDVAEVELIADKELVSGITTKIKGQRLNISEVVIPISGEGVFGKSGDVTTIRCKVNLREVPEGILDADEQKLNVRWEGRGVKDVTLASVDGVVNAQDPAQVERPDKEVLKQYGQLINYSLSPSLTAIRVRARGRAYNPMGFEVVVESLEYTMSMGKEKILTEKRPGFVLPAQKETDIKIEQDVSLNDAAGALAALAGGERALVEGVVTLKTPKGHRAIPIRLERGL